MRYKELYELVIQGFLLQGYEIYKQCSFLTSLRRWKLVHATEDLKVLVRYAYYEKE